MIEQRLTIGLVLACSRIENTWADTQAMAHAWRPVTVFAAAPEVAPWTPLGSGPRGRLYYAGAQEVTLFSTETANYIANLASGEPRLWVVMRPAGAEPPVEIVAVTADPAEGEAHTEAGNNTVETIEMPAEVAAEVAAFVSAHHVERPMIKRKRDKAPADGVRRIGGGVRQTPGGEDPQT
jgi:hypothetical protein